MAAEESTGSHLTTASDGITDKWSKPTAVVFLQCIILSFVKFGSAVKFIRETLVIDVAIRLSFSNEGNASRTGIALILLQLYRSNDFNRN